MPAAGKKGTVVRHGHGHVRASAQDRRDREQQDSGNRVPYPAGGCPSCREKEKGGNSEEGFLVIHQAREEKIGLSAAEGTAGTPATVHW